MERSGSKPTAPPQPPASSARVPFSIAGIGALLFSVAVLLLVGTAFVFIQWGVTRLTEAGSRAVEYRTAGLAHQLSARLGTYTATVEAAALGLDPARVMAGGDAAGLRAEEARIRALLPTARRVMLVRAGDHGAALGEFPLLGHADLVLVSLAESRGESLVEAHHLGQAGQHFDIVRPIWNGFGADRVVLGSLLASFAVEEIGTVLARADLGSGYAEVSQIVDQKTSLVLAAQGDRAARGRGPSHAVPIPGTRWVLSYWQGGAGAEQTPGVGPYAIAAALILAFGAVVLVLFRGLARAIDGDIATVIAAAHDLWREKSVRRTYPLRLENFRPALERLLIQGKELQAAVAPAAAVDELAPAVRGGIAVEIIEQPENEIVPRAIFKAYDIRGIVGRTLTEGVVYDIGRAIGGEAAARGVGAVAVARDGRLSGEAFVAALGKGIRDSGIDIVDLGMVPTPLLYYAAHRLRTGSGVMVTGSHNPPEYNGFKIMLGGDTLSGDGIQRLRARIEERDFRTGQGGYKTADIIGDYVKRVAEDVAVARPMRLVVDCGNGVAGVAAPRLLSALGCEVTALYCDVDGRFPNHHPDPSQVENLRDLIRAVEEREADLGLAFDGDGDRLGVVDSRGTIIWPDRQMMLYAADIIERHPGAEIIYDVKCSRHLGEVIAARGGRPLMWQTGHSLIKAKMKESGALLAGEMSGHIFFKERWYGFDDALYTAARLLEILARDPRPSAEVFAALPNAISTPELRVQLKEGEPFRFMKRFLAEARFPGARLATIDGLRADFAAGWGLVRASNTTPSLILRFEADDEAALQRIQAEFRAAMLAVDPALALPF